MTSSEYRKLSMLLSNIKNGSRDAFSGIYFMYEKKVYFLFCKILKSKSLAKQMTVEFFDFVYLKSATFGNAATFEKWLYTSLFSRCRRYLIDNQPEAFGDYIDTDSPDGDTIDTMLAHDADEMVRYPDGIDISVDMMQTVDSILSELPLKLRVVALQYYFCGFEFAEMASAEQISLMAVKNRLYKAHIRLETEEHKYSEIGYDCDGIVVFMPDILTTMAESIVTPADIASGVTSRTGVNCFDKSDRIPADNSLDNTSYINIPQQKRSGNYVTTSYAAPGPQQKQSMGQNMSPTVKVLMAIVALLIIIGGTVAVVLAVQGNKNGNKPEGSIANIENTAVQTTIEITVKQTTTESETTTQETTTETETTTEPETTTQETTAATTAPETQATTAAETTTESIPQEEPAGNEGGININDIFNF